MAMVHEGPELDPGSGNNVNMIDGSNNVISIGRIVGPHAVECDYLGRIGCSGMLTRFFRRTNYITW
jgi:hypothetical protein